MINAAGYGNGTVEVDGMREDVMERLRDVCEKIGVQVNLCERSYKKPILFTDTNIYIFKNASNENIETLIKYISYKII